MADFMPWRPTYSVGDDSIDAQHKQIVRLINELYFILHARAEGNRKKVREVLDQLVRYTVTHFQHEEQVLQKCGYPDLENHKALHVQLKRRTAAMRSSINLITERDMLGYLKDWWSNHILEQDKSYEPFIHSVASHT
jgi:hemerythrin-like metal-binding protein